MNIEFQSVKLKNFLSYSEAEIDLASRGFCLIRGQNNCTADNALSNGSGKSAIINAICWCVAGETISGIKNDVKNIYIEENECFVELNFKIDKNQYKLIRYCKPKSDLKIYVNDEDKSGKGVRESENQLALILPDFTRELLTSTILLGQGLPDKLSAKSPSGRKDLLEKLTKSDYMIENIKNRLSARVAEVSNKKRTAEDSKLVKTTAIGLNKNSIEKAQKDLSDLDSVNYDSDIDRLNDQIADLNKDKDVLDKIIKAETAALNTNIELRNDLSTKKQTIIESVNKTYLESRKSLSETHASLLATRNSLVSEINRMKSIKDICPTCGQKLVGVVIPNTADKENDLAATNAAITASDKKLSDLDENHKAELVEIDKNHADVFSSAILKSQSDLKNYQEQLSNLTNWIARVNEELVKAQTNKANLLQNKANFTNTINNLTAENQKLSDEVSSIESDLLNIEAHLQTLKQIETLIKRDFRGYLLENIIRFLDNQAKSYAVKLFNHNNISVCQDGNNISMSFNEKVVEVLSGGERQKFDLIIQLALRDLLQQYMDIRCNLLFLDEVTDNLDEVGCNNIFTLISQLNTIDSVFIISHHALELQIPVDSEIVIVKNEAGISKVAE